MASNHIESNTLQFSEDMEKPHILVIATWNNCFKRR